MTQENDLEWKQTKDELWHVAEGRIFHYKDQYARYSVADTLSKVKYYIHHALWEFVKNSDMTLWL